MKTKHDFTSVACEIRTDDLTRQLYATDASVYQVEPVGVAFPRSAEETRAALAAAADAGVEAVPRGGGTGLAGGALGSGLVINLSRYNKSITAFNRDARTVRVGAGVVLDTLNAFLKPHGLWFGPDVATSSRATLGGMIANNSSGAHAPVYGTTAEHLLELEVVLSDGRIETVGPGQDGLSDMREAVDDVVARYETAIRERFPELLMKRWPGYGLDRYLRSPGDLAKIICGSEGTLGCIVSATLNLSPLPTRKGIAIIFFASVDEAMQATVELLDLHPAAIEHADDFLFDMTRGQVAFQKARGLLRLDDLPCKSFLVVEFYDDVDERLRETVRRNLGLRTLVVTDPREMEMVWNLRKSGLSLLTGRKGGAKPVAGIEDVAVRPQELPAYVTGLESIMNRVGLQCSYYGHAASGLLHVRPIVDMHHAGDIAKFRQVSDEVSALVRQFKGSFCAEHGVGIARTEYLEDHIGRECMEAMRAIKAAFDPGNLLNPGKIVDTGAYRIDSQLRWGPGHEIPLPFTPVLAFADKDGSFVGNLEQCNGCGGCTKEAPTMCPTYIATGEEIMSTRGRANVIRAVLEGRLGNGTLPLRAPELAEALEYCLSCKACTKECPSNVNMTLLKAELSHAQHQEDGLKPRDYVVSNVDLLGRLGTLTPRIANAVMRNAAVRWFMEKTMGFAAQRPLPPYASFRFDRWFARRNGHEQRAKRGRVFLWDDTFVRYNEPNIGQAAVAVLEAAGFEVALLQNRKCCGRPAFSMGRLDLARKLGEHNVKMLLEQGGDEPVVFLEPSCYSMFAQDYKELHIEGAQDVAKRCMLFEQFIEKLLQDEPGAISFKTDGGDIAIHAHCHTKALTDPQLMVRLLERLPESSVKLLDTGCCGMAGAFGAMKSKYDLSVKVGQDLADKISALKPGTTVVACGTSCRHQIEHLTDAHPVHVAELLAAQLESPVPHRAHTVPAGAIT